MSENLIYGADILAYGAVADGATDCSDAFIKAIENGENLIVVPYGKYFIKKTIKLNSNTKIHLHPNAHIIFDHESDENSPLFYAEDESSVEICGGKLTIPDTCEKRVDKMLHFKNTNGIRISNCDLSMFESIAVILDSCEDVRISDCVIKNHSFAINLLGECNDVTVKNSSISSAIFLSVGNTDKKGSISQLNRRNVQSKNVGRFINFFNGTAQNVKCENINGSIVFSIISVDEGFSVEDADFENINVHSLAHFAGGQKIAYFDLRGSIDGLEIINFKRNAECEARPLIPTLILKPEADTTALIDGMLLDNVINARALSKTVKMTTARLTNPTGKFIYTLECGIDKGDALTIPFGDFDSLTIYEK